MIAPLLPIGGGKGRGNWHDIGKKEAPLSPEHDEGRMAPGKERMSASFNFVEEEGKNSYNANRWTSEVSLHSLEGTRGRKKNGSIVREKRTR